jgi:hypothetical protein
VPDILVGYGNGRGRRYFRGIPDLNGQRAVVQGVVASLGIQKIDLVFVDKIQSVHTYNVFSPYG